MDGRRKSQIVRAVFLMEWVDPPFCSGLLGAGAGRDRWRIRSVRPKASEPSVEINLEAVLDARPEIIVLALCGYDVDRAQRDYELLRKFPGFDSLPAAQNNRIPTLSTRARILHDPVHASSTVWRFSPAFCIPKNFPNSVRRITS